MGAGGWLGRGGGGRRLRRPTVMMSSQGFPLNGATEVDGQVLVLFRQPPLGMFHLVKGRQRVGEGGLRRWGGGGWKGEGRQVTPSVERPGL